MHEKEKVFVTWIICNKTLAVKSDHHTGPEGDRRAGRQHTEVTPFRCRSKQLSPGERRPLPFQVFSQGFLDLSQQVCQSLQRPLHPLDVENIHNKGRLGDFFHQRQKLCADTRNQIKAEVSLCEKGRPPISPSAPCPRAGPPLEPLGFHGQQVLDVCTARKDAFQVDPAPLHVNPHIKQSHDAI